MLNPLKTIRLKNVTIGFFKWIVEDKETDVIRICGELDNGTAIDKVFKLDFGSEEMIEELLKGQS